MTLHELEILDDWRLPCVGAVTRCLRDIAEAADDLTSLMHTRDGIHELRASKSALKDILVKLHDLAMDLNETEVV